MIARLERDIRVHPAAFAPRLSARKPRRVARRLSGGTLSHDDAGVFVDDDAADDGVGEGFAAAVAAARRAAHSLGIRLGVFCGDDDDGDDERCVLGRVGQSGSGAGTGWKTRGAGRGACGQKSLVEYVRGPEVRDHGVLNVAQR